MRLRLLFIVMMVTGAAQASPNCGEKPFNYTGESGFSNYHGLNDAMLLSDGTVLALTSALQLVKIDSAGKTTSMTVPTAGIGRHIAEAPGGKIMVLSSSAGLPGSVVLARLNADGSPDLGYGESGVVRVFPDNQYDDGVAMAVRCDGAVYVLAGLHRKEEDDEFAHYAFNVSRILPGGTIDMTFGENGRFVLRLAQWWNSGGVISISPEGRLVFGGNSNTAAGWEAAFAGLMPAGYPDSAFGLGGNVLHRSPSGLGGVTAMQWTAAGGYYSVGMDYFSPWITLLKHRANGTLDETFGKEGRAQHSITHPAGYASFSTTSLFQQPSGSIVVGARGSAGNQGTFAIVRFTPAGAVDRTFGEDGIVFRPLGHMNGGGEILGLNDGSFHLLAEGETQTAPKLHKFDRNGKAIP